MAEKCENAHEPEGSCALVRVKARSGGATSAIKHVVANRFRNGSDLLNEIFLHAHFS
jgi:hypothetical protein